MVTLEFGGSKPESLIPNSAPMCAIIAATIDESSLFLNLISDFKSIAKDDQDYIHQEVTKLFSQDIIEIRSLPILRPSINTQTLVLTLFLESTIW